jgi:hypothetical protein
MPSPYAATVQRVSIPGGNEEQMIETIRRMGQAIRRASVYPPIRNHAAAVATTAPPKNFLGQLQAIYRDFIKRWRYVKDPTSRELLTASPEAIWRLTMAGDGVGVGYGKGAGDCDCATIALGAQLEAIGFQTRLGTTVKSAIPGRLFGHVFIQARVPKFGWVTLDPVLHPKKGFGALAKHNRIGWWDLDGRFLGFKGNYKPRGRGRWLSGLEGLEEDIMLGATIDEWPSYGFGGIEPEGTGEPAEWSMLGLNNWGWMDTPQGKMSTVASYGYIDGAQLGGLCAEVDENDDWGGGTVRTPMLELALDDYEYVVQNGAPYDGMVALGDTGEVYYYDGLGGFFKKLFRKIKKGVKKVGRRIKKGIKKVLKKSRFGRFLLKIGGKIKRIAMKIVRPLMKFVGKWAGKLAPIAALIPGYGTAIAGALAAAGKVANLMKKWGVSTKGKKGQVRGLKLKNPKKLPGFKKALSREADRMKAMKRSNPARFKELATKLARTGGAAGRRRR